MDAVQLQDRISRGMGVAARRLGVLSDAYRPSGIADPLARSNRFLRFHAAFSAQDGRFAHPNVYGSALWLGTFDSAYTKVGDYLVQGHDAPWFIAAQQSLLPVLCVQTNRVVSFARPAAPVGVGINSYGGALLKGASQLMHRWPASVLAASSGPRPSADLPADSAAGAWNVLVPAAAGVILRPADMMVDDLGRRGNVTSAELTDLGWRLLVRQATT